MFKLIFAIDRDGVVGDSKAKYGMPWHYPEDLKFYKSMTTGKRCLMGRTTYEAIGSALPNRETFVITTNENYKLDDATVINNFEQMDDGEWMICGGVSIFKQFWNQADEIYITRIDESHDGDVKFTDFDLTNFTKVDERQGDNPCLSFEKWVRNDNR